MRYLNTVESLVLSDQVFNAATTSPFVPHAPNQSGKVRNIVSRTTTTGTTTTSGSTYLIARLPSNARILRGSCQGIGSIDLNATAPTVGVRMVNQPNTAVANAFTAVDIDDTGDHLFVDNTVSTQDTRKKMWEWAGLTVDCGGEIDIILTLAADAVVAGVFVTLVDYVVD